MSVNYLVTNVNQRTGEVLELECYGGCFGALNHPGPLPAYASTTLRKIRADGTAYTTNNPGYTSEDLQVEGFIFKVCGGKSFDLARALTTKARNMGVTRNKYVYDMLVELFNDIPYYREMVSFNYVDTDHAPAVNMYFDIDSDTPADKVITAAFLARNLTHNEEFITYDHLRSLGYKPHFSAIIASIVKCQPDNGVNPFGRAISTGHVSLLGVGEYNWVHSSGIGKEGVIQLLSGEEPEWQLESWLEAQGYHRENWFRQNSRTLNGRIQCLVDWATIVGDQEHFLQGLSWSSGSGRFNSTSQFQYESVLGNLRSFADELQNEYRINIRD